MSAADLIEKRATDLPAATLVRRPSFDEVCTLAAERTAELLAEAVSSRGSGHLALTGGSAGIALARSLPATFAAAGTVGPFLENVHLWFGDERFVAAGDPDRNDLLVTGLVEAGIPETNVHRVCGPELVAGVDAAAGHLAEELSATGPADGRFDVVHLGVGPDAHVCSLFPGHPAALLTGGDVVPVRSSPKPPPERVSLTFDALHRSRCVMAVAGGAGKAEAVRAGLGMPDAVGAPASCARGLTTTWYLDDAAANGLTA